MLHILVKPRVLLGGGVVNERRELFCQEEGLWDVVGVGGGGGVVGVVRVAKILQKIMAPPLSVIKMVKYCSVGGGGGIAKIPQKLMAPPLSVIKMGKYCGVGGGGGHRGR